MTPEPTDGHLKPVDLPRLVATAGNQRIAWSTTSRDLHVNLIVLQQGESIPLHRNDEVDVLIVGIDGAGEIAINGAVHRLTPDTTVLIPQGTERSVRSLRIPFAYLTCHRRREMLWPAKQVVTGEATG